jgi:hypothetical protein
MTDTRTERLLVAEALVVPSGITLDGVTVEPTELRRVPGFVESVFSPLAKAVIDRCLAGVTGGTPFGDEGARTALVLATVFGDTVTSDLGSRLLASGQVANPLLFFQSVPTTILGVAARDHNITGPTTCVATRGDLCAEALDLADSILGDDGVDQVLLLGVELAAEERPLSAAARLTAGPPVRTARVDTAVAFLIRRTASRPEGAETVTAVDADDDLPDFGGLAGLVRLYLGARARRTAGDSGAVTVDLSPRVLVKESR